MNSNNRISITEVENEIRELGENNEEIRKYIFDVLNQGYLYGTGNDFHNLAVGFAKRDDYDNACAILEVGLDQHTHNVDLLADYLEYGTTCGKMENCRIYYERLCKIPKRRWTWRGFDFSVDYLMYMAEQTESEEELDSKINEMLGITQIYRKYKPDLEGSYQVEAGIYHFINEIEKEIEILKSALNKVKVCPKCCLRLADLYFERGEINQAMDILRRAQRDSIRPQWTISTGYVYFLTALCLATLIHENEWFNNRLRIRELYQFFRLAKKTLSQDSGYLTMLEQQINIFEVKTGRVFNEDEIDDFEDDDD